MVKTVLALTLAAVVSAAAQDVISARAGYVNYKHGDVTLPAGREGKPVKQLMEGQSVSTRHGRVEILLTPGTFLRLDHESEARLLSSSLRDGRAEIVTGTATLEVNEIPKGNSLGIEWQGQLVPIMKTGLYRFEPNADSMRVYVEKGKLRLASTKDWVKSGKYVDLSSAGTLTATAKYNRKDFDEFDRWNIRRGEQLALASYSVASSLYRRSMSFRSSGWFLDPYFGFYTYLPYSSSVTSPWGFVYQCPRTIYHRTPSADGGSWAGGGAGGASSAGGGGGGASAGGGATGASAAPSSPGLGTANAVGRAGGRARIPD